MIRIPYWFARTIGDATLMWGTGDMARAGRTMVQLRPGQIVQRARLRTQRTAAVRGPFGRWMMSGPDPESVSGWPDGYTPLDLSVWRGWPGGPALHRGEIDLLGVTRALAPARGDDAADWTAADWGMAAEPLLWRYHLYYWDWAWSLVSGRRAPARALFAAMWESWHARIAPGRGPAWRPYPAALRAWSFCGLYHALVAGSPVETPFRSELAAHAGFLRRNLETDVGGNHLLKNLKALAGLAVFFGDDVLLERSLTQLTQQLTVQVLPDGGHYERAPAYHCQVLGDLMDVAGLLRAAGRDEPRELSRTIGAMRGWLGAVLTPAGEVPLLNDGYPVSRTLLDRLRPVGPPAGPLHLLPDTGLARATAGEWHLLADIGLPCPRELPAHAHADTLSCLVHLGSEPLLIDTGTSTYAPGPVRAHERSTAAHNTLEVDQRDSTEVWGAFRAGRRARVSDVSADEDAGTVTIAAAHDGYRSLRGGPRHHRRWSLRNDELRIEDTVTGRGRHHLVVRWHLAPGARLQLVPGGAVVTTGDATVQVTVTASRQPTLKTTMAEVSTGFGRTVPGPVLTCTVHPELPIQISTVWRRPGPRQETA